MQAHFEKANRGKPREPLRTLKEFAEEFGVSWQSLAGSMAADMTNGEPDVPAHVTRSGTAGPQRYFRPSEMRAWWKRHTARASTDEGVGK